MPTAARRRLAALVLLVAGGCEAPGAPETTAGGAPGAVETAPSSTGGCDPCHGAIVREFRDHGMAASIGPVGEIQPGAIVNPRSGARYELLDGAGGPWLRAVQADGGERRQRLVGRVGAGIFDVSWVGAEVDVVSGADTGRLFFAPVETVTGHGLALSPFDTHEGSPGLDMPLDESCLTCHTDSDPGLLEGAARSAGSPPHPGAALFPTNLLGSDAFERLEPIGCASCHGEVAAHLEFTERLKRGIDSEDIRIARLARLPAARQRDVCGRCHLQGDVRLELAESTPGDPAPLAGRLVALVPAGAPEGFRFVGQLERLALSACFRGSPRMTCTSCHRPHSGVAGQGTASFDAACAECHALCARPAGMTVEEVTGEPARTAAGCVDCHVRRSQPFDLPHVRSVDHFVRRRIPPPESGIPHRQFSRPRGEVRPFDDGRLEGALSSPGGRLWRDGVVAMALATMGRFEEAAELFARHPAPGTAAARAPRAPAALEPIATAAAFHESRGLTLVAAGDPGRALLAYGDALVLDPLSASARLGRARLRIGSGDLPGAMADIQALTDAFPRAEQPWALRLRIAELTGRPDAATAALREYVRRWPSNAVAWAKLGLLLGQAGDAAGSRRALERARRLSPDALTALAGPAPRG